MRSFLILLASLFLAAIFWVAGLTTHAFVPALSQEKVQPPKTSALGPGNVFILANKNMPESRQVAEHYCQKRMVPKDHIIFLDLPKGEDISRKEYETKLRDPVREALKDKKDKAKVLLSVYGVPLRVGGSSPSEKEKAELTKLKAERDKLDAEKTQIQNDIKRLEGLLKTEASEKLKKELQEAKQKESANQSRLKILQQQQNYLNHAESQAAVDSELMLLWWDGYELRRWQINLLNFRMPDKAREGKPSVLMVSRLDGPSVAIALRLVDDAVEVEKKGLAGKVYVDARGISLGKGDTGTGYGGYDESLREMAELLKTQAKMPVILDNKPALFEPKSCPDTALYCGWYSLAKYVDCCEFNKGAVAYHIASSEAVSLRNPKANFWCPRMLDAGVCATLGPVAEPYTIGFPKPAEFFGFLVTGKYTLVECYSKTVLLNSWMTTLVGDPLYNPYAKTPKLQPEQVLPSPKNGLPLFKGN